LPNPQNQTAQRRASAMDKFIFIPSVVLSVGFFALYGIFHWRKGQPFQTMNVLFNSVFEAFTIVMGVMLIASSFIKSWEKYITQKEQYIFIAGAAILCFTGDKVVRKVLKLSKLSNHHSGDDHE
jgi:uncharacterized membrane protein